MQPERTFSSPFFIIFLIFTFVANGCAPGRVPSSSAPSRFKGTLLRIQCPDKNLASRLLRQSKAWESNQGVRIEIIPDQVAGAKPEEADIVVLPSTEIPGLIVSNRLEPLPESFLGIDQPFNWNNILPIYKDRILSWGRTAYGVPLVGDAPILVYRQDLLSSEKHKEEYRKQEARPLEPPQTWADLKRISAYFKTAGIAGLPRLSSDPEEIREQFYTLAAAYVSRARSPEDVIPTDQRDRTFSFHRNLSNGKPLINSVGFVYALKQLKELESFRTKEGPSGVEGFLDGESVFCLTQAWAVAEFQKSKAGKIRDRIGFAMVPAGEGWFEPGSQEMTPGINPMVYLGSQCRVGAVMKASANREAAFDLLSELAGRDISGQTVIDTRPGSRWAGGAIRFEQLEERFRWDAFDLDADHTSSLKQAVRDTLLTKKVKNPVFSLRVPDQAPRQAAVVEAIRQVLAGKKESAQALDEAAAEWNRLDMTLGIEKARQEYLLSLGFQTQ